MHPRLRGEIYLSGASLSQGDGSLEYGCLLAGERKDAAVVIRVGVKAQDADALNSADGVGDARDSFLVAPLAEIGDGLEEWWSHGDLGRAEGAIEVNGGAYEGEVGKGLGEVAQRLAPRPNLLGVEAEVVGIGEHLLQGEAGLVEAASLRQALDEPEGAEAEAPLVAPETVWGGFLGLVAVHERVVGELFLNAVEGREPARVGRPDELREGHEEERGVESVRAVVLDEAFLRRVPALLHDLLVDPVPLGDPTSVTRGQPSLTRDAPRPLQGDPAHDLGGNELPPAAPDLPDPLVRFLPVFAEPAEYPAKVLPEVVIERCSVLVVKVRRVEDGPVEVELYLSERGIAEPHGAGVQVTGEVVEFSLREVLTAIDAVERLEESVPVALAAVPEVVHEVARLFVEPDGDEGVEREGGVAQPRVAVVPVALAADPLRQTHRRGRDQSPGRVVDHELEDERRAMNLLPPPPAVGALREPAPPEDERALQELLEIVLRERLSRTLALLGLRQDERGPFALLQGKARPGRPFRSLLQRHHGREPEGGVGRVLRREESPQIPNRDEVLLASVVEGGAALDVESHLAAHDAHVAH